MRIELQPAYILHTRPYRDTSLLVDFFTPELGRVAAVARGVRQRKGGKRSLFNPFTRLLISLQGKHDLKLLTAIEATGSFGNLLGEQLYSGFYLNELLIRLLPEMDAHPHLFDTYHDCLHLLQANASLEPLLRNFEFNLLQELGYAVDFVADARTGSAILADRDYWFDAQTGFYQLDVMEEHRNAARHSFYGADILAIGVRDFSSAQTRRVAKHLSRIMLQPLLGARPLKSRELFASLRNE